MILSWRIVQHADKYIISYNINIHTCICLWWLSIILLQHLLRVRIVFQLYYISQSYIQSNDWSFIDGSNNKVHFVPHQTKPWCIVYDCFSTVPWTDSNLQHGVVFNCCPIARQSCTILQYFFKSNPLFTDPDPILISPFSLPSTFCCSWTCFHLEYN